MNPAESGSGSGAERRGALAPWSMAAAGLAAAFYPAFRSGFRELQINPGDPRLVQYLLEHTWRWLRRLPGHGSLWDQPMFHPAEGVGAYTDTMLGAAPPYWLFRALGLETGPAFQLWMMACLALNFLATYLLLTRGLRLGRWPSAAGAFLTGFGIARVANFNSPQLFPLFWGLFALVAIAFAVRRAGEEDARAAPAWTLAAAGLLALQVWSAFYPAFFLLLALALALPIGLALPSTRGPILGPARRHPAVLALALAGGGAAIAPMVLAHLAGAADVGWRSWEETAEMLPTASSWIFPGGKSWLYGRLGVTDLFDFPCAPSQFSNGLGFATTLLCLVGLAASRRPAARLVLATTAAVILISSAYPGGASPWYLVWELIPGGRAVRFPARVGLLLTLGGSIGLALFLDRTRSRLPRLAAVGLVVIVVVEQLHDLGAHDEAEYRACVDRIAEQVEPDCEAFFLSTRLDAAPAARERVRPRMTQIAAMWASLEAGVPTVNGFSGHEPPGWDMQLADTWNRPMRRDLEAALERWVRERDVRGEVCRVTVPGEWMPWIRRAGEARSMSK